MKPVFFLDLSRPLCFLVYCNVPDLPLLIEFVQSYSKFGRPASLSRGEEHAARSQKLPVDLSMLSIPQAARLDEPLRTWN
jgi:hypothetical protein